MVNWRLRPRPSERLSAVSSELTWLYWNIGTRIREDILLGERAEYGAEIVQTVSAQLSAEYGRGFGRTNLLYMMQFAEAFPDPQIVQSVIGQLSWTHFLLLLPIKDNLKRGFYIEMCRLERWSVRTLRERIDSMLFERTALSRKPDELIVSELEALRDSQRMSPSLIMRDPYILDFLELKDTFHEDDLEAAIIREMEAFLLELGAGFSFIARQKRIQLDGEDFYLDLLFYNRKLKRLVIIHPVNSPRNPRLMHLLTRIAPALNSEGALIHNPIPPELAGISCNRYG